MQKKSGTTGHFASLATGLRHRALKDCTKTVRVSSLGHSDCDTGLGTSNKKTDCEGERRCSATQVTSCPPCNGGAMGTIRSAWEPVKNACDPIKSVKWDKPQSGADLRNSSRFRVAVHSAVLAESSPFAVFVDPGRQPPSNNKNNLQNRRIG